MVLEETDFLTLVEDGLLAAGVDQVEGGIVLQYLVHSLAAGLREERDRLQDNIG